MKRSYIIAALFAVAAAAWLASGQFGDADLVKEGQKPPADLSAMERVATVRVNQQRAEPRTSEIVVRGRTEAWRKVMVKAEAFGRVEEVLPKKGSHVAAGDTLVKLAPEDRPARLREAQALLEQRKLEYVAAERLSKKGFRAETQLAASKAALESARATVRRAETDFANTTIKAPIAGVISERLVEVGDFAEMGDAIMKVLDLDPVLAVGYISERNLARLHVGGPASVRLITGQTIHGQIRYIGPEADPKTRTFRIEVEMSNQEASVVDGITAEIRLPAEQIFAHRISPAILTLADDGEIGVKILGPGNTVEFKPIRIIDDEPDGLWVSGLPEQVVFITVGQEFVTSGQTVLPVDEETLAPFVAGGSS
ncbi:MAG: efflux RND transporter periplasmic adaptor subunit [Alphaproteobacteria bacterium]